MPNRKKTTLVITLPYSPTFNNLSPSHHACKKKHVLNVIPKTKNAKSYTPACLIVPNPPFELLKNTPGMGSVTDICTSTSPLYCHNLISEPNLICSLIRNPKHVIIIRNSLYCRTLNNVPNQKNNLLRNPNRSSYYLISLIDISTFYPKPKINLTMLPANNFHTNYLAANVCLIERPINSNINLVTQNSNQPRPYPTNHG